MTPILFFFKQLHAHDKACARRKALQSYEICFTSTPHRAPPLSPHAPHIPISQTSPSLIASLFLNLADFTLSSREPLSPPRRLHPLLPRTSFSTSQTSRIPHVYRRSCRTHPPLYRVSLCCCPASPDSPLVSLPLNHARCQIHGTTSDSYTHHPTHHHKRKRHPHRGCRPPY